VTRWQAAVLAAPAAAGAVVGGIAGLVAGAAHWLAAAAAIVLCVLPAFGTFWLTTALMRRTPFGGLIGMTVGVAVRMLVAVGGGAAVYFGTGAFEGAKLGFWLWILSTYLATLVAETALIAGRPAPVAGAAGGKG
jgi:hypothetical protein